MKRHPVLDSPARVVGRKELALSSKSRDSIVTVLSGVAGRTLAGMGLLGLLSASVGCETKSFLDPGEVGRFEKTPLLVPILDKVVVGVEQDEVRFAGAREVTPEDLVAPTSDAIIGANDVIQVTINDLVGPGLQSVETKRVSQNGKISLPMLGQIDVAGLTEAELELKVNDLYASKNLIVDARTSVAVLQALSRRFSVFGFAGQQNTFEVEKADFRLLDALVRAQGVNADAGVETIYIIRKLDATAAGSGSGETGAPAPTGGDPLDPLAPQSRSAPASGRVNVMLVQDDPMAPAPAETPATETPAVEAPATDAMAPEAPADATVVEGRQIQIEGAPAPVEAPLDAFPPVATDGFEFQAPAGPGDTEVIAIPLPELQRGELQYNIVIKPGDMIFVPTPQVGEYYMGGHVLRPGAYSTTGRRITLKQALIAAGGLDQVAIPARTELIRRIGVDQEVFVRVDLERIAAGLEPDLFLKPNDQIRVGTNAGAPFLAAFRNAFRITYGFGFLYDRNYGSRDNNNN